MIYLGKTKERLEWKGENYTFTFSPDLSNGVTLVTNKGFFNGDTKPELIAKDVMLFSYFWFENYYGILEKFEGFEKVEFCIIPF